MLKEMAKTKLNGTSGFSERLRKARIQKELSQVDLAHRVGVHSNQISRYEKGLSQPATDKLHKLAAVLEVSGDYLMSGNTENGARANFEDQDMLRLFQKASALSPENKDALKRVIRAMFSMEKIEQIAAK